MAIAALDLELADAPLDAVQLGRQGVDRDAQLRGGLVEASQGAIHQGQGVEDLGEIRVVAAEALLPDRQGAPVERLGFVVAAPQPIRLGQIVQAGGDVGMLGTVRLFPDG